MLNIIDYRLQLLTDNKPEILKGISFSVAKGETVGIVGESGSGKSMTCLSLLRLLPPSLPLSTEGALWFESSQFGRIDLKQVPLSTLRRIRGKEIAMVFQEPMTALNPVLTCGEQVAEAIRLHQSLPHRAAKTQTLACFEQVQLPNPERIYRAYPHQLSGGQKQRVMIAMAISCKPQLLIADEPTTALDVTVQRHIVELLKSLQQEYELSLLFISHDLALVAQLADAVVVMKSGEIVEQGRAETLFRAAQSTYTKGLLACRPTIHGSFSRLPTLDDLSGVPMDHIALTTNGPNILHTNLLVAEEKPIVEVKNLSVLFRDSSLWGFSSRSTITALDDVSFQVQPGVSLGVVGESGSGKTTLGRCLIKLLAPSSGIMFLQGQDITQLSQSEFRPFRKLIQMVFQDPYGSLNPRSTIGQTLMEPLLVHHIGSNTKDRKERIIQLLEQVQLPADFQRRYPAQLSGGQRQRVGIARALACQPKILICDESVSALDVSVQAQILNLLADLRESYQLTLIFISHDLSVIHFIADQVLVLQHGKMVDFGSKSAIFNESTVPYTQELLAAVPQINW
jgi:peptide/nickel transport system ATP-binding protein